MKQKSDIDKLYERLLEKFVRWAERCPDIRIAIIVGSRARTDRPADEWADLDLIMVTTDPQRYISSSEWIKEMGNPLLTFIEATGTGDEKERRVLYEGMLDVDYSLIPFSRVEPLLALTEHQPAMAVPPGMAVELSNVFGRGMRVILDKDGIAARLQAFISAIGVPTPQKPSEEEFLEVVNDFLYHSVWTAKHLKRGELWWALTCINCYLARLMLRMIEWHAGATKGGSYDTWFRGRFLEEWADREILARLQGSFTRYNFQDGEAALMASLDLFNMAASTTAQKLGYHYPSEIEKQIAEWIEASFSQ